MKTEILISCDDWENRVAVLEEGSLAEIYFEREEKVIGSIYKGRVENVLPGMGACFVNIGLGRNAFLYVDDIMRDPINIGETEITDRRRGHTVNELLKVGSDVLVQIVKEPRGLKGARVSTNVSLPGRYLVLMPTGRYSGVSSRIEDAHERERLKQIMRRVRPEGMATIVRTAAQGVSEAELIADLGVQLRLWHGILESYKRSTAPALLHKDLNLVFKAVRDFLTSDVTSVYIDSKEQFDEIRSTMSLLGPQYIDRLKLVEGPGTLFAQRGIDEELQKLLKPKIPLPSGGHLVLEHTEALTVIDVNTGKFTGGRNLEDTIVRTNIEAAAEIARQVRLRDIGGIIVVDFIDMTHERNREQVISTLTDALRRDRTRSTIQVFSNLGLLEFTRKRVGKDLSGQLRSDCPYCTGLGSVMSSETVAIGVLRQIRERIGRNGGIKKLDVVADAGVATQLEGWYRDEFEKLARDHELDVALYVEPQRHREHVIVEESRRMRATPLVGSVVEAELLAVRLPNPASGVAEVNGYLIEVKDAANATGQTVKLRISGVEGNMVRAELAEPLPSASRRRRGQRGRGKDIAPTDAPIAPPAPSLRDVQVAEDGRRHAGQEAERRPARLRRPDAVAFSVADDDDEAPRVAAPAARGGQPAGRAPKSRTESARSEGRGDGRGARRRPGARRGASSSHPPALVVGGEGDIDYDDGDNDAVITKPSAPVARQPRPGETDAESADGLGPRRRRRRGRGGKGRPGERPLAGSAPAEGESEASYEDDEAVVAPRRPATPIVGRERSAAPRLGAPYDEDESEDGLDAVVDPRQPGTSQRPVKRFGPVRQIYGRPVALDENRSRGARPPREERPARDERSARDDRPLREERPARDERSARDDRPLREERPARGERFARDDRPVREERPARDERSARDDRPMREESRGRRPQGSSHQARPQRPPVERRPEDDEELDIVIKPQGPAAIHVDIRDDVTLRRRPSYDGRDRDERELRNGDFRESSEPDVRTGGGERPERGPRDRGDRSERPERGPRPDRGDHLERPERAPRQDRGERGERRGPRVGGSRFGGPSRGRPPSPKREGPTVKQLYPPPDDGSGVEAIDEERPGDAEPTAKKPGFGRQPRGPLMRPSDAPPVPKGKVRQLYPPPPEPAAGTVAHEAPALDHAVYDEPGDENNGSLFVSDTDDMDDRRRRARERADARRRSVEGGAEASPEGAAAKPFDGGTNESDEWPVF